LAIQSFIHRTPGLEAVVLTDSLIKKPKIIISENSAEKLTAPMLIKSMYDKNQNIKRLLYRQRVGYSKAETFILGEESNQKYLVLMFVVEQDNTSPWVAGLVFELDVFANETLREKISEFAGLEIVLGLFERDNSQPAISSGNISLETARVIKNLWLFPNHVIGIRTQDGANIEEMIEGRFRRSLLLIFLLDVILLISAWILYRAIRREMELARMKSDFVSNVSHELRTPLALIRMFSETLEMKRVTSEEKKHEYYQIINQETIRLTHLINNILDFSKMEAEKKQFNFKKLDLNKAVSSCLAFYKFHLVNNGFKYHVQYYNGPLIVEADRDALTEALINLLENAIKYSREIKEVTVKTGVQKDRVFVEVQDKGIGITEKDQKLVFEKFYRGTDGLVHNTKGSGLGLALVKYAMQAHQGSIEVNSTPGKGSRFRLLFPVVLKQQA